MELNNGRTDGQTHIRANKEQRDDDYDDDGHLCGAEGFNYGSVLRLIGDPSPKSKVSRPI